MKKRNFWVILTGVVIGIAALALSALGNPGNMGFCIACFLRDTSGALKLHSAEAVQYVRPEIVGMILGAMIVAMFTKEFKPRGGSSPMTRFVIAVVVMIGALMFLGCPFRMILRIAGGDLNAIVGLAGFVCGILIGTYFLNKGFSLQRTYRLPASEGVIWPIVQLGLIVLLVAAPTFILFLLNT